MMSFSLINTEREGEVDWQWAELWASEQDDGSHVTCGGRWRARQRRSLIKDELMRTNNLHRVDGSKFPLPALTCCSVKHGGPTPPDVLVLDVCVRMLRVGLRHHDGVALDWLSTHFSSLQSVFYSVVYTDLSASSITAPASTRWHHRWAWPQVQKLKDAFVVNKVKTWIKCTKHHIRD